LAVSTSVAILIQGRYPLKIALLHEGRHPLVHLRQTPQMLIRNWNKRLASLAPLVLILIVKRR
jgi:hypothetical protein